VGDVIERRMGGCLQVAKSLCRTGKLKETNSRPVGLSSENRGVHAHVENGRILSGRGAAMATDPIESDRVYFELKLKSAGAFAIGVGLKTTNPPKDLDREICDNKFTYGLKADMLAAVPEAGDVIGVLFDQRTTPKMSFSLNGLPLSDLYDVPRPGSELKLKPGQLYPVAYVNRGAMVEINFSEKLWEHPPDPRQGYKELLAMQSMM
jgi:hypothetical protein